MPARPAALRTQGKRRSAIGGVMTSVHSCGAFRRARQKVAGMRDAKARHSHDRVKLRATHHFELANTAANAHTGGAIAADQRGILVAGMAHEFDCAAGDAFEPAREEVLIEN